MGLEGVQGAWRLKECPLCGAKVKVENLERHVRNRHPREEVDLASLLTEEEVRRARTPTRRAPVVTSGGIRLVAAVIIIVAVVVAVAIANPFRGVGPGIGQVAPDFELSVTTGGTIRLSDYRGSPVLLEFMDVDCIYCIQEARDVLPYLYENYTGRARFLSVSVNFVGSADTPERVNQFRTDYNTPWVYAIDDGRARSAYGVGSTPTTLFLDREGIVVQVIVGAAPGGLATYAAAMDAALQG